MKFPISMPQAVAVVVLAGIVVSVMRPLPKKEK